MIFTRTSGKHEQVFWQWLFVSLFWDAVCVFRRCSCSDRFYILTIHLCVISAIHSYSSSNSSENYEGGTALSVRFIGWNLLCSGLWSSRMFRGGINAGGYKYSFSVHFAFWLRHIFAGVLFLEENGFWVRGGLVERGKTVLIKCIHSEVLVRDVFNLLCHVASLLDWLFCCWADGNSEGEYGNECHTNTHKYYEV